MLALAVALMGLGACSVERGAQPMPPPSVAQRSGEDAEASNKEQLVRENLEEAFYDTAGAVDSYSPVVVESATEALRSRWVESLTAGPREDAGPDWSRRRVLKRAYAARERIVRLLAPLGGSTQTVFASPLGARSSGCDESCSLGSEICRSATVICELASQYPDMPELESDCVWATIECEGAKALCSRCRGL